MMSVALVAVTLALAMGLAAAVAVVNGRTAAVTAADAAALAAAPATFPPLGLEQPDQAAAKLASDNGARLVSCSCAVDATWSTRSVLVEVEVEIDVLLLGPRTVRAISRAEFSPVALTEW